MIVVSDTTPIISLLKIGQLSLLEKLFHRVMIPKAVYTELTSDVRFQSEAEQIRGCTFIEQVKVTQVKSVELLRRATGLDKGESEAIIYTDENKADLLLMDEAKGRQIAKQMGLKIMGTVGILLAAYEDGLLQKEEIIQCVSILRNSRRHISEALYEQLMERLDK